MDVFKWDEMTAQLLKIIIFLVHQNISAPRASKITHLQVIPATYATRITPLDLVEEAPFNRYQQVLKLSFKLSMTSTFTKLSLTVDTAFRKDLSLQGVHFTHTYHPTLNATGGSTIPRSAGIVWFGHDLYLIEPYP